MNKWLATSILALLVLAGVQQSASAWSNCKFSIGLNIEHSSGNNNFLWGFMHNGQVPSPYDAGPADYGVPSTHDIAPMPPMPPYAPHASLAPAMSAPDAVAAAPPASYGYPMAYPASYYPLSYPASYAPMSYFYPGDSYYRNGYFPTNLGGR